MKIKKITTIVFFTMVITFYPVVAQSKSGNWANLFNGKDLKGWIQRGGKALFTVEKGEIVGTSVPNTPNSFLCTEKDYGDFILELELKVDTTMNSGIQLRSHSMQEYQNGRVHGYQMEVDPSKRRWSGGIYDEGQRGWLYTLEVNPDAKPAFKNGQWNKYRIEAIGSRIRTFINDVPCADLLDNLESTGFIALQVHKVDPANPTSQIRWRNIRILTSDLEKNIKQAKEIPQVNNIPNTLSNTEKKEGWKLLFDGVSSKGWRGALKDKFPEKGWVIEHGALSVVPKQGGGNDIVSLDKYGNFDLTFEFMLTDTANGGIKYYVTENEYDKGALGLEYQILDDAKHPDAKKGIDGNRTLASLYDLKAAKGKRPNAIGEWNKGRIVAKDNKIQHWLNGIMVLEYVRGSQEYLDWVSKSKFAQMKNFGMAPKGYILIQEHNDKVYYRNIKIKEL
jgi:hypothetical protein